MTEGENRCMLRCDLLGNLLEIYVHVRTPNFRCEYGINSGLPLWRFDSFLVIRMILRGTQTKICIFSGTDMAAGIFQNLLEP